MRRFTENRSAMGALIILSAIMVTALLAPWIAPHNPLRQDISQRLIPPAWTLDGNSKYLLGTDQVGRDVFSRILYGGRVSLTIGLFSVTISALFGVSLGIIAGYVSGWVGDLIMRLADIQHAFPFIVLAIAIIAILGPGMLILIVILAIWGWAAFARVARAETLSAKEKEYVEAARSVGAKHFRIMIRHIFPNVVFSAIVLWTTTVAQMIIAESALSFLGLGIQIPNPSWGNMISDGRQHIATAWWLSAFPGLWITITVLTVNLVGDGLRDALDPRLFK